MLPNQLANNTIADANQVMENFNYLEALFSSFMPSGLILPFGGKTVPASLFLECDGTAVSRTTYDDLFNVLVPSLGTFTVTIASPGVFTLTGHGLLTGDQVYLTTTGALPTGLSQNTIYWVTKIDANTFKLATSLANAKASTNINTTGTQSGVHTVYLCPWGLGDGSTTFNLPNLKGKIPVGIDVSDNNVSLLNVPHTYVGEKTHFLTTAEMPSHTHVNYGALFEEAGSGTNHRELTNSGSGSDNVNSGSAGSDGAHNNMQPYVVTRYIIKT